MDTWLLDNGCNNHMIGDESIFQELDTAFRSKAKLGNGALVDVTGKDKISVETKKGMKLIPGVMLVPSLRQSLLSVGQMMEKRYVLHFEGQFCTIYDKFDEILVITKVRMQSNRNFPSQWRYDMNTAMKVDIDDSWLWHKRFGHFNFNSLNILHQKDTIKDFPCIEEIHDDECEGCLLGKEQKHSFPSEQALRAKNILELVHTYVCGPIIPSSHEENISDGGKKYNSKQFDQFYEEVGIKHQLTVGYTPK
ncbi:hypothetical protein RJ640_018749 [Escallonia rubra]|uniref:GAG-pre-integrase domain-containing protein n=1 Tax=Escallonia rubra TaxID=112253 RepID=A0AA88UPB0_9ASTE|nr:hypothetical protein RJ640_018749 [Escallonia rubra]